MKKETIEVEKVYAIIHYHYNGDIRFIETDVYDDMDKLEDVIVEFAKYYKISSIVYMSKVITTTISKINTICFDKRVK